jgi:IS5 family transposase
MARSKVEEAADAKKSELNIPEEIRRREDRLSGIERAKAEIERREKERYEKEKAEYDAKMEAREKKARETGKKARGKAPEPPKADISGKAQVNLTDEDSRIMPKGKGTFAQSYNAQAGVDVCSHLIINKHVTQACNDKEELEPSLLEWQSLPEELGRVEKVLCDAGYYSEENLQAAEKAGMHPYIPAGREKHNEELKRRMEGAGAEPEEGAGVKERTAYRMKTESGRKEYGQRKGTSEPVFGIIKQVMGYGSFLTRGLEKVQKEWTLICIGYNLKRLFALFNEKKGVLSPVFKIIG